MFARARKYELASLVGALICLAGCAGNANPPPMMPRGTTSIDLVASVPTSTGGTTFYVDGGRGNNINDCRSPQRACKTIQHAVHISASDDTIDVTAGLYPENVTIHHNVHINGAGRDKTIVDGQRHGSEFLIAFNTIFVTISGMTMRGGSGSGDGGGIYHCFGTLILTDVVIEENLVRGAALNGYGGAMYNCPSSIATIVDSTIRNNSAKVGGAICNGGLLTIIRSTFNNNTALEARGGGAIFNYGILHVANSTFSGNNAAEGVGGAIHNGELVGLTGGAQIANATISTNSAAIGGSPLGGGIYNKPGLPILVQNTIIADNKPQNCGGARLETEGFNLSSDTSCHLDHTGDLNGVDPKLGSLQNNGGPTSTMALGPGSAAIDAGNGNGCRDWLRNILTTDQRGMPRPDPNESRGCDIGAYESR